ncbi:hypothetical protein ABZP36_023753 [Zizania latifolia]
MYHAIRLRCLLTRPPVSLGISTSGGGGGCFVRRLSAVGAPRPWGAGRRLCRFYGSSKGGVGSSEVRGAAASAGSSGRRERFHNEFLRGVVPWEKGNLTWQNFPYYVNEDVRQLLSECVASHLRHKGACQDYGDDYSESEEEDAESEDEVSESEIEDEGEDDWTRSSESKSGESDDDIDDDALKSVEELKKSVDDLRKLVPCTIEEFAKRIAGAEKGTTSESSESPESSEEEKKAYQRGLQRRNRKMELHYVINVMYIGQVENQFINQLVISVMYIGHVENQLLNKLGNQMLLVPIRSNVPAFQQGPALFLFVASIDPWPILLSTIASCSAVCAPSAECTVGSAIFYSISKTGSQPGSTAAVSPQV